MGKILRIMIDEGGSLCWFFLALLLLVGGGLMALGIRMGAPRAFVEWHLKLILLAILGTVLAVGVIVLGGELRLW